MIFSKETFQKSNPWMRRNAGPLEVKWGTGYKALPLDFIDNKKHPLYEKYHDLVVKNVAFYMEQLSDDGVWDIFWGWGSYPNEFAVARRYWQGILTLNRYKTLLSIDYLK